MITFTVCTLKGRKFRNFSAHAAEFGTTGMCAAKWCVQLCCCLLQRLLKQIEKVKTFCSNCVWHSLPVSRIWHYIAGTWSLYSHIIHLAQTHLPFWSHLHRTSSFFRTNQCFECESFWSFLIWSVANDFSVLLFRFFWWIPDDPWSRMDMSERKNCCISAHPWWSLYPCGPNLGLDVRGQWDGQELSSMFCKQSRSFNIPLTFANCKV